MTGKNIHDRWDPLDLSDVVQRFMITETDEVYMQTTKKPKTIEEDDQMLLFDALDEDCITETGDN